MLESVITPISSCIARRVMDYNLDQSIAAEYDPLRLLFGFELVHLAVDMRSFIS